MTHVLVAHSDEWVREAAVVALHEEAGHIVMGVSSSVSAIAALRLSEHPVVALLDERLPPFGGLDILNLAAIDEAGGLFARHRYVLLSTWGQGIDAEGRQLLERLDVPVLPEPFELAALIRVVDEAAEAIVDSRRVSARLSRLRGAKASH
jgi:CheY-like chemotaxis protein